MELTVGILRSIIKDLSDDVILTDLVVGNDKFHMFIGFAVEATGGNVTITLPALDKNCNSETLNNQQ